MYISEQYSGMELLKEKNYVCIKRDGERVEEKNFVLSEHLLEIYVNEVLTMKVVCTEEYLAELVLGRLFTEGVIESVDEIEGIFIYESGSRAKVTLCESGQIKEETKIEIVPTCCTGNQVLNDWFVKKGNNAPIKKIERMDWKEDWIFAMADRMANGMPLHSETWGTHSCFLSKEGELVFSCEDIGRHNALDKVIGYALRNGIALEKCLVYSSGRIPVDMAEKVIKAGIPVLASKAVPTKEAIELAEKYGLTLICSARRDRMRIYTGFQTRECEKEALILAGGKSTRMGGEHKGNLLFGKETFMERMIKELNQGVGKIWVSYGENIHETYEGCHIVVDEYMNCGPIGGIHAGLKQCQSEFLFVMACDMPFLKLEFFEYLEQKMKQEERKRGMCFDAVVPVLNGKIHPLASIYRKSIISILEGKMKEKKYRLVSMLECVNTLYVDVTYEEKWEKMLQNINTVKEYECINHIL